MSHLRSADHEHTTLLLYVFGVAGLVHAGVVASALFEERWRPFFTWELLSLGLTLSCVILYRFLTPKAFSRLLIVLVLLCAVRWVSAWLWGAPTEIYTTTVSVLLYLPVLVGCWTLFELSRVLAITVTLTLTLCSLMGVTRAEVALSDVGEWRLAPAVLGAYLLYSLFFTTWRRHLIALYEVQGRERELNLQLQTTTNLQLASRMGAVSKLSGEVAHEFNNLLNVISPLCEHLMEELSEHERLEDVGDIQSAAERMRVLTHGLLSLTQTTRVIEEEVDLVSVIRDLDLHQESAELKSDIRSVIQLNSDHERMSVSGAKDEMTRMIELLIELARSTRTHEELTVSLSSVSASEVSPPLDEVQRGEVAFISIGQAPERSVTRAHQQVKLLTSDDIRSELKLSAAYAIALRSSGVIRVGKDQHDQITFKVYLPCLRSEERLSSLTRAKMTELPSKVSTSKPEHREEHRVAIERPHILLVDDEEMVLKVISRSLTRSGYHVTSTSSALRALELLRAEDARYDMIISDVRMPELSGPQMIEQAQKEQLPLPIHLFITGHIDDQAAASFKVSAEQVLFKPFTPKTLRARIERLLSQERSAKSPHS